ncbi:MAG: hypothetical protein AB8B83_07150 [Bdellovibrionales bacterium]
MTGIRLKSPELANAIKLLANKKSEDFAVRVQAGEPLSVDDFDYVSAIYLINKTALSMPKNDGARSINMTDRYKKIIGQNNSKILGSKSTAQARILNMIGKTLNRTLSTPAGELTVMAEGMLATGNQAGAKYAYKTDKNGLLKLDKLPDRNTQVDWDAATRQPTYTPFAPPRNPVLIECLNRFSDANPDMLQSFISDLRGMTCTIENGPLLFAAFRIMDDVYSSALQQSGGQIEDDDIYASAIQTTIRALRKTSDIRKMSTDQQGVLIEAAHQIFKNPDKAIVSPVASMIMRPNRQFHMVKYDQAASHTIECHDGLYSFAAKPQPKLSADTQTFHGMDIKRLDQGIAVAGQAQRSPKDEDSVSGSRVSLGSTVDSFQDRVSQFAPLAKDIGDKTGSPTQFHAPPEWDMNNLNDPGICIFTFPALRKHVLMSRKMGLAVLILNEDDRDPVQDLQSLRYRDLHDEAKVRSLPLGTKKLEKFLDELKSEVETDYQELGPQSKKPRSRWAEHPSAAAILLSVLASIEGLKTTQSVRRTEFKDLFSSAGKTLPDSVLDFQRATPHMLDAHMRRSYEKAVHAKPTLQDPQYGPTKAFETRGFRSRSLVEALAEMRYDRSLG